MGERLPVASAILAILGILSACKGSMASAETPTPASPQAGEFSAAGAGPPPTELVCPKVPAETVGICAETCSEGSCPSGQLCCSNGCGHVCTTGIPAVGGGKNKKVAPTGKRLSARNPTRQLLVCPIRKQSSFTRTGRRCVNRCQEGTCSRGQLCCNVEPCGKGCVAGVSTTVIVSPSSGQIECSSSRPCPSKSYKCVTYEKNGCQNQDTPFYGGRQPPPCPTGQACVPASYSGCATMRCASGYRCAMRETRSCGYFGPFSICHPKASCVPVSSPQPTKLAKEGIPCELPCEDFEQCVQVVRNDGVCKDSIIAGVSTGCVPSEPICVLSSSLALLRRYLTIRTRVPAILPPRVIGRIGF